MRRLLFVLAVAFLLGFAGCVDDPATDGDDIELANDTNDANAADLEDGDPDAPGEANDATDTVDGADHTDDTVDDAGDRADDDNDTAGGTLELHHIDVGQADSTLLVSPEEETMLVDTGDWRNDGELVIEYLDELGVERIDHLVATHAHADHIGGHAAVIEHFEEEGDGVGAAYDSGVAHGTQTYENYLDAVESFDVDLFAVEEGDELPFGDVDVTVLNPPEGDSGTDLHYNSVTLAVEFGEFRYLTTGDAEDDTEERLLEDWPAELEADVYHAGHHGSATSSSEPFLERVNPEAGIISSAFDSQYGHPHDEVLERFADHGMETYWTGIHGDIVVTAGPDADVAVETEHDETTDPEEILDRTPGDDDEDDAYDGRVTVPGTGETSIPATTQVRSVG